MDCTAALFDATISHSMKRYLPISLLFLLTGCGFQSGSDSGIGGYHWSSLYRQDIHTVCVPIFTTVDYHRGVEFDLSDALVKKIEEFTPYKVVSRDHADTILEGEIVAIRPEMLSLNPYTATPQEERYTIVVNFTWKQISTGKVLVSRENFEEATSYFPLLGEGQEVAAQNTSEQLAMGIVHEMEAPW
jgi:hypothetical protein